MNGSELLFYGGIGLMAASGLGAVISIVVLRRCGKCLRTRLEEEFGKRRH